jgi:hypothetical protein
MSASDAIRTGPRGRPIVGALIGGALVVMLAGAVSGPAVAARAVHLASGPLTVTGSASRQEMLNVVFDPRRCAVTLKAEAARPDTSSWKGLVDGQFKHTFGPGAYPSGVARWVCVYVQSLPPNPMTLAHSSTPLS